MRAFIIVAKNLSKVIVNTKTMLNGK